MGELRRDCFQTMRRLSTESGRISYRRLSSARSIHEVLKEQVPVKLEALKQLRKTHGAKSLGSYTVDQCLGGGRDIKCMFYETSLLDPLEGIRFRGYSIPELQAQLPSVAGVPGQGQPTPESLLWLLLTSEIPTAEQAKSITEELRSRSGLPQHVESLLRSLPKTMHPMTQLSIGLLACQPDSKFVKVRRSTLKSVYWEPILEDVLDVIAKLPEIAAIVYRHTYKDGKVDRDAAGSLDYSAGFNRMLGFTDPQFDELMRLYLVIHADHEGGNASAHATHLAGSALSDPYLSYSAGLNALAGPLHGLANQEVLSWIQQLQRRFEREGTPITRQTITDFAWETLKAGKVIPGYGHAVLRRTDPRYECQRQFALQHLPEDDPLLKIVSTVYEVMPTVLSQHGKTKNPYPNVDAHSGVLLWHYGLREYQYYTVLFGVSRAMGALSQLVWDRALQLPLENPKSVDTQFIVRYFEEKAK